MAALQRSSNFSFFIDFAKAGGLKELMGPDFEGTLFAPDDRAMKVFTRHYAIASLLDLDAKLTRLVASVLHNHLVATPLRINDLRAAAAPVPTLLASTSGNASCASLTVTNAGGKVLLQSSGITDPAQLDFVDVPLCNNRAVLHPIDRVLVPSCADIPELVISAGGRTRHAVLVVAVAVLSAVLALGQG